VAKLLPTAQIFSQMHPPLSTKKFVFVEEILSRRRSLLAEKKTLHRVFIFVIIYLLHLEIDNAARHTHTLKMAKARVHQNFVRHRLGGRGNPAARVLWLHPKDEYETTSGKKERPFAQLPRGFSGQQRAAANLFVRVGGGIPWTACDLFSEPPARLLEEFSSWSRIRQQKRTVAKQQRGQRCLSIYPRSVSGTRNFSIQPPGNALFVFTCAMTTALVTIESQNAALLPVE
jgi:hypothetical protein